MAWEARIINATQIGTAIHIDVEFYDETAPDEIFHRERLRVPLDMPRRQIRDAIINAGQEAQADRTRSQALSAALLGVTITIPDPGAVAPVAQG